MKLEKDKLIPVQTHRIISPSTLNAIITSNKQHKVCQPVTGW